MQGRRSSALLSSIYCPSPPLPPHFYAALRFYTMSTTETITQPVTVTQPISVARPAITAENVRQLFPEVNTTIIGGSHASATSDNALDGYNEEQIRLMDEVCIVLDENDVPIGSATKKYSE